MAAMAEEPGDRPEPVGDKPEPVGDRPEPGAAVLEPGDRPLPGRVCIVGPRQLPTRESTTELKPRAGFCSRA
jgi:hypothetical protein